MLIDRKNVIRMKVPYPDIESGLAAIRHMYICKDANDPHYGFIKCQTLKPYMLNKNPMQHYVDEQPDISRNPFERLTRIDCDKLFTTDTVRYHHRMLTNNRTDVCQDLYDEVVNVLMEDGHQTVRINEDELLELNFLITRI